MNVSVTLAPDKPQKERKRKKEKEKNRKNHQTCSLYARGRANSSTVLTAGFSPSELRPPRAVVFCTGLATHQRLALANSDEPNKRKDTRQEFVTTDPIERDGGVDLAREGCRALNDGRGIGGIELD
jgi:hypothetical protein